MDWQEQVRLSGLVFLGKSTSDIYGIQEPHCTVEEQEMPSLLIGEERFGHSCVLRVRPPDNPLQEMILLLGGQRHLPDRQEALNSVFIWNGKNGNWSQGPSMIQARNDLTAVLCGDSVYAIGGENVSGNSFNSIERISIKSLLTDYTTTNNNKNRTTAAWQTFHCCMTMPRACANAVSVQDRYIVVAGGRSNAVVGQSRYHQQRPVLASVEIIDTHFPTMPYDGPSLNYPRYSFGMGGCAEPRLRCWWSM